MKKLSLLFIIAVAFSSCKKKYCWKCDVFKAASSTHTNETKCDMTQDEINAYEKANSSQVKVWNGNNYQYNTVMSTKCTQQ